VTTASSRDPGEHRPSPDAPRDAVGRAERKKLKVFVGPAPGVGKTYAMLQAAWERAREGADVVVGVVETHDRTETDALLEGLEIIPKHTLEYRGKRLEEMDLDAILARRPQIVLVDELAHTNVPGSLHPKRWSDVEELLEAGIEVYTTINIQHIESLNDVVAQVTGIRVHDTVPDGILERAGEIKLVDLPPEDLIQRLREGKVYVPPQAARSIEHYFNPGNLTALRELALRYAAERVDDEMQTFMRAHAIAGPWAVTERIMVCVSDGPLAARLVRAARRMAARRHAEWIAVFVETIAFARRPEPERHGVIETLRLAEQLGGEAVTIAGQSVGAELVRYARERNVTELVLGKPARPWWRELVAGSPIAAVIRESGDIDVRVITGDHERHPQARPTPSAHRGETSWSRYGLAALVVAVAGGGAQLLQAAIGLQDPAMVFLTGVLVTAVLAGLGPSIAAAFLSAAVYDFFFVDPRFRFTVAKPEDILSLIVFLIAATLTSQLTARARDQAALARRREERSAALYAFARQIAGAVGLDDLLPVVVRHLAGLFDGAAVVLVPDDGQLAMRACEPPGTTLDDAELAAATWVWRHDEPAGPGTQTLPGGQWLYEPLKTARGVVGVLGLRTPRSLARDQRQLLDALADQVAVAIERTRIDVVLEEKAKTEAVIEAIEDGLIVLDPSNRVAHVNEVACAVLEVERGDVLDAPFDDLGSTHPHYLRLRAAVRELLANPDRERDRVELTLFLRGRDHHYVLRPTRLQTRDGAPAGLILTLQDVTYVRDQEKRRENLVATLSHELRTPLTSLRMAVELLRRDTGITGDETRALLATAHDDVLRLQDVAQQFLDIARAGAMSIAVERGRVNLQSLIERVHRFFDIQAKEKGVRIESTSGDDGSIPGDETKLTWALSNLVANAVRYTPSGGRITIATAIGGDDMVELSVTDDGPGIPPERQERIFERFTQYEAGGDIGAAGLGLAIVRDIVQAHGGRVHLESTPGHGTRFTVELPRS
jgi:two-component system sensor histidine kinase KdpD